MGGMAGAYFRQTSTTVGVPGTGIAGHSTVTPAGQPITGSTVSLTVTLAIHESVLAPRSMAVKVTGVLPTGKTFT